MEAKMIGNKIVKARKEKKLSQEQVAQHLSISPQEVLEWERGASIPDLVTSGRLAEILGVDLNYFSEAGLPGSDRQVLTNFSASDLTKSDFAGVTAHKIKFEVSTLPGSDFSGADLTGSSFKTSDTREANFDGANLTDCKFSVLDLAGARFNKTTLVRTEFNKTGLSGAKFTDVTLIDVKLTMIDLRETVFEKCAFNGVDFKYCDLRGLCLDGLTFIGVRFDRAVLSEATFKGTTLKNVSFLPAFALTNKYYRDIKAICFDGAMMDKLTYAALKGIGAGLSKVTVI